MTKAVFLLLLVPALAFAQGQILFANNEATAITNITTAQPAITFTRVGFYINPNPSASPFTPGWVIIGYTNLNSPGIFLGGTRTLPGFPADTPVGVQIRAWLTVGSYTSFEDACVAEPIFGLFGQSVVMQITPSDALGTNPTPTLLGNGFTPFRILDFQCVPEPTTLALTGLGLAFLAFGKLARRRTPSR